MKGVGMWRATFYPEAKCTGGTEPCGWLLQGHIGMPAVTVRSKAQHHARKTGHVVIVDIIDRTTYNPDVRS